VKTGRFIYIHYGKLYYLRLSSFLFCTAHHCKTLLTNIIGFHWVLRPKALCGEWACRNTGQRWMSAAPGWKGWLLQIWSCTAPHPEGSVAVGVFCLFLFVSFLSLSTFLWPSSAAPLHTSLRVPLRNPPLTPPRTWKHTHTHTQMQAPVIGWLTINNAGHRRLQNIGRGTAFKADKRGEPSVCVCVCVCVCVSVGG